MKSATKSISSDSIDMLRSLLTDLQRKILNLRSIGKSDADIAQQLSVTKHRIQLETDRSKRLFVRCKQLCPNLQRLTYSLLHAPIDVLHVSERTYQALRDVFINRVCDFYKQKITQHSLQYFPHIGKTRAKEIKEALTGINLPLAERTPNTAIYGLFDVDNHGIFEFNKPAVLNDRHIRLMYQSEDMYGMVDVRDVAEEIELDAGLHRQLIPYLERTLNGTM